MAPELFNKPVVVLYNMHSAKIGSWFLLKKFKTIFFLSINQLYLSTEFETQGIIMSVNNKDNLI